MVFADLAKKLNVDEGLLETIVCYYHAYDKVYKKKELVTMTVNFEIGQKKKIDKFVNKIMKALKVTEEAVIVGCTMYHLKKEGNIGNNKEV